MKALILSAGYGTRLGEVTRECPKPMLRLLDRPLLELIICQLRAHGFHKLAVNLHFLPHQIQDYFGDGSRWGVELTYSFEQTLLGTAGALKKLDHFFRDGQPFLVHYGDVLTDQDFSALLRFHRERDALCTLLVHSRRGSNSFVRVEADGRISAFLERPPIPPGAEPSVGWVNSGVLAAQPEFLDLLPDLQPSDLPLHVFPQLVHSGRFYAFPLSGYRCAIDGPERLAEARQALAEQRCHIPPAPVAQSPHSSKPLRDLGDNRAPESH